MQTRKLTLSPISYVNEPASVSEAVEDTELCGVKAEETKSPMILSENATNLVTYTYSVKWTVCCVCLVKRIRSASLFNSSLVFFLALQLNVILSPYLGKIGGENGMGDTLG